MSELRADPRYLRATVVETASAALLPSILLALVYIGYRSGVWNGPAVRGGSLLAIVVVLVIGTVAFAFPAVAFRLHRSHRLRLRSFAGRLALSLSGVSLSAASIIASLAGGPSIVPGLTLVLFALSATYALPSAALWLKLALR